ncbi:U-box domain-containing protein 13 [Phtheirospermum japonicum]|uniref:U-box domain-containing protein 13 n=1 Tax=Phtheirospermum japonicum TaxID=374723 RepID=A0A830B679_9LAMI|nr:U-box domain-containing protein 13 [Phtheirospermum japonicum]
MAEAFRCGEKETQILAAKGIGKLNSQQKQRLCENGVCSLLVEMVDNQDYESIVVAMFALLSLACGCDRNKVCIEKAGAIPAILKILRCQNIALMELSLTALLVLSTCSANKIRIASSGAIQLILQFLDSRFTTICISTRAKLDIISTLHNLSTCPQMIPSLLACGGLNTLNQLIYEFEKS